MGLLFRTTLGVVMALAASPIVSNNEARAETIRQSVWVNLGGQAGIRGYRSHLKLSAGYAHWLADRMSLEAGASIMVLARPDVGLVGGIRWRFGQPGAQVRPFVRTDLEVAFLVRKNRTAFVIGPRVGGGAGYYKDGIGATLEAGLTIGPAFGDGVRLGSNFDVLVGAEFPF